VPQLAAIGMVSNDLAAAARFYRLLGVEVPEPDGDHLDVTLPSGVRLMWDTASMIEQLDPEWTAPQGGHAIALAFECASPQEVDEVYARVVEAGFTGKKEPFDAFWGQRYATVVDADGNGVDLFAAL
jgi:catechol 2,3-dioxygenase-like lactoylglutathione lyase family enzyme